MRKTPIFKFFHIIYNVKKLFINIISIAINISKDVNDANINLLFFICFSSLLVHILSLSFLNSPFLYFMSKMISFAYSIKNTSPILFLLNIYAFILEDILTIVTKISSFFDTPVFGDGAKKTGTKANVPNASFAPLFFLFSFLEFLLNILFALLNFLFLLLVL